MELIRIACGQFFGIGQRHRLTDHLVLRRCPEGVKEPVLDERDGQMRDVDPDPPALEPFRDGHGCSATAEWVKHRVTFIGAGFDDPL